MLLRVTSITLLLFCFSIFLSAQSKIDDYEFLPDGIHFLPLKANIQEARIGVYYFTDNSNLKVDVGNSIDLVKFYFPSIKGQLTVGIEFMAYAWATSTAGNRLQIDALDGFFGGNAAFSKTLENSRFVTRFRIIHNSAHLVDGHYDISKGDWMNGDTPIPFTRDFGELTLAHQLYPTWGSFMYYGAISYSTLVRPINLEKWTGFTGFELSSNKIAGSIFRKETNLFIAYQLSLFGNPNYNWDHNIMAGIKFGEWDKKGIVFYLSYYDGHNYFSEYYQKKISKFGIGFQVDFY